MDLNEKDPREAIFRNFEQAARTTSKIAEVVTEHGGDGTRPSATYLAIGCVSGALNILAMCVGAGTFNLLGSFAGGALMFLLLYAAARWATETDPQILKLLLASAKARKQYDPAKFHPVTVRRPTRA